MAEEAEGDVPAGRLDALTDGVVAIAITLLVLDLRLPEVAGPLEDGELLRLLFEMRHQFASYAVSFVVVGILWLTHVRVLRGHRADAATVWLTFGFLAAVSALPFTTALLSRSHGTVSTVVYAGSMALASLMLSFMTIHRHRPAGVAMLRALLVPLLFLASIGLAFWNPPLARLSWVLIVPASRYAGRRRSQSITRPDGIM